MGETAPFMRTFVERYGTLLAFNARDAEIPTPTVPDELTIEDWQVQRDSGCRSITLRFHTSTEEPKTVTTVTRECDRYPEPPPPYRSRRLPFTANGPVELLAHCGYWGNGIIESYVGKALDKYGDVYSIGLVGPGPSDSSSDQFWRGNHTFMEYERTVPPEEVERLLDDTEAASHGGARAPSFGIEDPRCSAVFDTGRGFDTVELDFHEGDAASRARDWLHKVLGE